MNSKSQMKRIATVDPVKSAEELARLKARIEELESEVALWKDAYNKLDEVNARLNEDRDRYRRLIEWLRCGIEHFTHEDDQEQVEHLINGIDRAILNMPKDTQNDLK